MAKVKINSEARNDHDVIPFETEAPVYKEGVLVTTHKIKGYTWKNSKGRIKSDVDHIIENGRNIKATVEKRGGAHQHRNVAKKHCGFLFDGVPGFQDHNCKIIDVDFNQSVGSSILTSHI
jgi:hypothetical protein